MNDHDEPESPPSSAPDPVPASRSSPVPRVEAIPRQERRSPLASLASQLHALEAVPFDEIPEVLIELGLLQSRVTALQSALASRSLLARGVAARDDEERWLSVEEVSRLTGVSTSWLYKRWKEKLPFAFRYGGKLVFPAAKVRKFLSSRPAVAPCGPGDIEREPSAEGSPRARRTRGKLLPWSVANRRVPDAEER